MYIEKGINSPLYQLKWYEGDIINSFSPEEITEKTCQRVVDIVNIKWMFIFYYECGNCLDKCSVQRSLYINDNS